MDYKAQQAARASMARALQAAHPHLTPVSETCHSLKAAAKNIRVELKRAYPRVTFSVKSATFSMGDAIYIRWTDGPTQEQVDAIADRYQAGSVNGYTDGYDYEHSAWKDAFGDAKYVRTTRENSDRALLAAFRTLTRRYPANFANRHIDALDLEAFHQGRYYGTDIGIGDLQSLIRQEAHRRTWAIEQRRTTTEGATT